MGSRFYAPASVIPTPITPAAASAWEDTSILTRAMCSTTVIGDAMATVSFADTDSADKDILFRQIVSYRLTAGQDITSGQAIKFQCRVSETSIKNNLFSVLGIRILAADGSTVRTTVLAVTRDGTEAATSLTNRQFTANSAITDYTTVDGDRLVIEVGMGGDPDTGATPGDHDSSMRFGDAAASDLAEDNTTTTDNNPWIELTDTLTFDDIIPDAKSSGGYVAADDVYAYAFTNAGNYLAVSVSMLSVAGSSVTGITYNGVALTKIGHIASASGAVRAELWGLIAPFVGTANIEVTLSAALDSISNAQSWYGVHQTSPTESFNSATATNVGAADATVTITPVADGCVVIDCVASDDTAITVGAGQWQKHNVTGTLGSGGMSTEGTIDTAAATVMSWANVGAAKTWSICGFALRPARASGTGHPASRRMGEVRDARPMDIGHSGVSTI